eukprot:gene10382-21641_t
MSVVVAPLALILPVENLLGMLLPGANILPHPLTTALLVPVIHLACHIYRVTISSGVRPFNNMNPRGQLEKIIGTSKSKDLAAKLARIQGAHDNGWEAYSLFSTGVLAAVFAGADKDDAARLSIGWLRSTVWAVAGVCAARLLVLAKDALLVAAAAQ